MYLKLFVLFWHSLLASIINNSVENTVDILFNNHFSISSILAFKRDTNATAFSLMVPSKLWLSKLSYFFGLFTQNDRNVYGKIF